MKRFRRFSGFTLMEILIVVSILMLMLMLVLINLQSQLMRARDAQRKTALHNIQKAFEEYFNDTQCYPVETILGSCAGDSLNPYIKSLPCDPTSKTPYLYVPGAPTLCSGYRICAKLEYTSDPDITSMGCDPETGCGWAPGYNYCLSSGFDVAKTSENAGTAGEISGLFMTPTPTPPTGNHACSPGSSTGCNIYANPSAAGCPVTYADPNCEYLGVNQCQFSSNWCTNY